MKRVFLIITFLLLVSIVFCETISDADLRLLKYQLGMGTMYKGNFLQVKWYGIGFEIGGFGIGWQYEIADKSSWSVAVGGSWLGKLEFWRTLFEGKPEWGLTYWEGYLLWRF
jgi:hypothetical protein